MPIRTNSIHLFENVMNQCQTLGLLVVPYRIHVQMKYRLFLFENIHFPNDCNTISLAIFIPSSRKKKHSTQQPKPARIHLPYLHKSNHFLYENPYHILYIQLTPRDATRFSALRENNI